MGEWIDDLARAMAGDHSRRTALRRMGGGLAGLLLAALLPREAAAGRRRDPKPAPSNDDCADFCREAFPPGDDRGQCVRQGAQAGGFCARCGGDADRVCGPAASGVCCDPDEDEHCCVKDGNSSCVRCSAPKTAFDPRTCRCECPPKACPGLVQDPTSCECVCAPRGCTPNPCPAGCSCANSFERDCSVCLDPSDSGSVGCDTGTACEKDAECPSGSICWQLGCAGVIVGRCRRRCPGT